jgi:hypothetical protein
MKTKTILTILLFTIAVSAESSGAKDPKNAVSIDVLLPVGAVASAASGDDNFIPLNIKYQRVLADHLVLMLKGGFNYNFKPKAKGIDIYPMAELDWHPFQKGLKGFYAGLSIFYGYSNYFDSPEGETRIALGPTLGWQFVVRRHLIIDLTLGLGFGYYNRTDWEGKREEGFSADETIGGIFLGWGF